MITTLESHLWEAANILRGSPVDHTDEPQESNPGKGYQRHGQGNASGLLTSQSSSMLLIAIIVIHNDYGIVTLFELAH